ncbi:PREDICTED: solute carrier organic anion transporter family member 6A1 [Chinchilla lanigera]|uniref:Solute carrier organic anion transporter family member n=1 Tax=Chinchilla lanigera TaxID=34839 RepID=A0A8C2VYB2_CHILA|nr:PREDICTED: solute carrier organic anion transporter family member 6A1 [Chinchilla lanigera]XP_005382268.1 PREDICTED: solute carrier organic anion transporter family member 6A1 [Chinchilla lanigera]
MPQGPALRLVTLREAQVEAESGPTSEQPMKRAQDAQEEEKEAKASKKKPPYLTVLPKAMLRFTRATKRKKAKLSALKKAPGKQSAGSAGDRCGLGCLVIPFCQRFNSIQWFMAFYCVLLVCQGIVFGLIDLSNNDFEQHHILTTTEKLALTLSYDISSCLVAVFIAYYGGSGNRIKWIAFSSFLVGFGSLLLAFPYFGVKSYESEVKTEDICSTTKILDPCLRSKSSFQAKYVTFFALGQIVQGMAGMPLYILGITFLDDNVYTHSSGIYLGIADAAAILGYALGYAIGAPQLESSQNSTSQAENVLSPAADVQQGKNWWPDFLFVSLLAWSTLIPFLCFPYNIAGTAKIRARKQKEFYMFDSNLKYWKFGPSIKELFGAVWMLLKTPVFMYQALSKASESLIIIGATEFLPIYLENQFILTPAMAASLTGLILIPGGALGQLLGGIIVCQLEMSCKALMRFIIASCTVSIVFLGILIFVHCDPVRFAGINENYNGTGQLGNLTAPCNDRCRCSTSLYASVCGRDMVEYFSPCFAGCTSSKTIDNQKKYYNCSCIKEGLTTADAHGDFIDAVLGKCDMYCYTLPLFFAFIFSAIVFSGFCGVPITLIIFRTIPEQLHSLAIGITYVIIRIFGTIPGPLLFKKTGETSCTFWDISKCGHMGRCWVYNKTKMAFILLGICSLFKICTICFTTIGFYKYSHFIKEKRGILQDIPWKPTKTKRKKRTRF